MAENRDKLIIIRGKFRGAEVEFPANDGEGTFKVCFNPTEYSLSKKTHFAEAGIPGLDSPILQFSRGEARTLSLELLLDTVTYGQGGDVRTEYTAKLQKFLMVDGELHAPPPCKVVWGSLEFVGVLEEMRKRYVLFQDDGTPVRVRVTLSFKEYISVKKQLNDTRRSSPDRRKLHVMKAGESLSQLAYEAYGDPRHWRVIADCNEIDNPREIAAGRPIEIPILTPGLTSLSYGH